MTASSTKNPQAILWDLGNGWVLHICVPNFGLTVKRLYDQLQGHETNLSERDKACDQDFTRLKVPLSEG